MWWIGRLMDNMTKGERSRLMSLIRAKDTKPEVLVRKFVFCLGFRYRLHRHDLPGRPDIVFGRAKKAIYVNGCFWHLHARCRNVRIPKSRRDYWVPKLEKNRKRDRMALAKMRRLGWDTLVLWECELNDMVRVRQRIMSFLSFKNWPWQNFGRYHYSAVPAEWILG